MTRAPRCLASAMAKPATPPAPPWIRMVSPAFSFSVSSSEISAVRPASPIAAACAWLKPSGLRATISWRMAIFSAYAPSRGTSHTANTASPTLKSFAPLPTALTTPEKSRPGTCGSLICAPYWPARIFQSAALTLAAWTSTSTSPGAGVGSGQSPYSNTSGPPYLRKKHAFIVVELTSKLEAYGRTSPPGHRAGSFFRRAGLCHLPRMGSREIRSGGNRRLRLRPAPSCRARMPPESAGRLARAVSVVGRAPARRPRAEPRRPEGARRDRDDGRRADQDGAVGAAQYFRPRPQRPVLHPRGRHRVPPQHPRPRRRHVRDRFFRLPGLPPRHHQRPAGDARTGDGSPLHPGNAADVDRQVADLGARQRARRRSAARLDRRGHPYLLSGRTLGAP